MKVIFATLAATAALVPVQSFASHPGDLTCYSAKGEKVDWSERFGEFYLTSSAGVNLESQDALVLGPARTLESLPPQIATEILHGDEEPKQHFATIIRSASKTTIVYNHVTFICN